jgi:hypothetical protein
LLILHFKLSLGINGLLWRLLKEVACGRNADFNLRTEGREEITTINQGQAILLRIPAPLDVIGTSEV